MTRLIGNSTLAERERKLKFAENFSSSAAVSDNGGTETNSPVTPFLYTGDGTTETYINYVYESEPRQQTTELTVMAWVRPTLAPDGTGRLVCGDYHWSATPADERGWVFGDAYGADDHFGLRVYKDGVDTQAAAVNGFFATYLNQWVHVAATFSGGNYVRMYVNGVLADEKTVGVTTYIDYYPGYNLRIGQRPDGAHGKWGGNIKEVKLFNAALDSDEILGYATNKTYSYRNETVAEWPLNYGNHDPTNSRSLDIKGENHLELVGDPTKNETTRGYYVDYDAGKYLYNSSTNLAITNKDFTMMVWFKVKPSVALNWNGIFRIADSAGSLAVQIDTSGSYASRLRARIDTADAVNQTLAEIGDLGNDWVLGTLTYDNATKTARLYFNDGKESSSTVITGTITADNLKIYGAVGEFKGDIIYMKLWYQKLTPIQIADQYYTFIKGAINRK